MEPEMAKMLLQSAKYKVTAEVLVITSMLGIGSSIFY